MVNEIVKLALFVLSLTPSLTVVFVNVAVSWTPLCLSDSRALPGWEAIHLLQKIQKNGRHSLLCNRWIGTRKFLTDS